MPGGGRGGEVNWPGGTGGHGARQMGRQPGRWSQATWAVGAVARLVAKQAGQRLGRFSLATKAGWDSQGDGAKRLGRQPGRWSQAAAAAKAVAAAAGALEAGGGDGQGGGRGDGARRFGRLPRKLAARAVAPGSRGRRLGRWSQATRVPLSAEDNFDYPPIMQKICFVTRQSCLGYP